MPFTTAKFSAKLNDLIQSFGCDARGLSQQTGIGSDTLAKILTGERPPTGDEILIFADFFKRDFASLIDDDAMDPDSNLKALFRFAQDRLAPADKFAIAEFLYLCRGEALLDSLLGTAREFQSPVSKPKGKFYKGQGQAAAAEFRNALKLSPLQTIPNLYHTLRQLGLKVFRRALPESNISGLFVENEEIGRCILINYSEDIYRQRFSVAHELGHVLLDEDVKFNISVDEDIRSDVYTEIRANAFASAFLIPPDALKKAGGADYWLNHERLVQAASEFMVSLPALLSALVQCRIISKDQRADLRTAGLKVPRREDPELSGWLSEIQKVRKIELLKMGLHFEYVEKCFSCYRERHISFGKLAELLLVHPSELADVGALFNLSLHYD